MNNVYNGWTIVINSITDELLPTNVVSGTKEINVTITKNTNSLDLTFKGLTSQEGLKQAVKLYVDKLESSVLIDTTIDFTAPTQTQAEIDEADYREKRRKLYELMELVRDGAFTGSETQITNLQNAVKTAAIAHPEYI